MDDPLPWIPLTSIDQLEHISQKSFTRTQIIFKHSTTCGISRMVFNMFGKGFDFSGGAVDLYYLDIHRYRNISEEVALKFDIRHQSPQVVIIKDKLAVAHESHGAIADINLGAYIK